MADTGSSFLPRIESVFYAIFDIEHGPKIVHQVPEGLIATSASSSGTSKSNHDTTQSPSSFSAMTSKDDSERDIPTSSTSALGTPMLSAVDVRQLRSPQKRPDSSNKYLFNFDDISKYIIPNSALYGRLVICATRGHRIIGFPVEMKGRYERNYFRFNLCFVFDRTADLSCFEPVIRKIGRVLTACEDESRFLSSEDNSSAIHAILEQLYEDLNSYRETSIPIDKFNSIELKIFPFFPNPAPIHDWQVPLALINLKDRIRSNWDLTIVKICKYIDGVNHIARIATLADCDVALVREAVSHLLYYQVVTLIDIFQFSNVYTLRKSIQWMADQPHVTEEGPSYVARPGAVLDWPKLLHLYSRLKSGKTVYEWMQEYDVFNQGIDIRRFISFGVVKGFLRRVHRWPILMPSSKPSSTAEMRDSARLGDRSRVSELSSIVAQPSLSFARPEPDQSRVRAPVQEALPTITSAGAELVPISPKERESVQRHVSAAERSLARLHNRISKPQSEERTPIVRTRPLRTPSMSAREPPPARRPQVDYSNLNSAVPTYVSSSPQFSSMRLSPDAGGGSDSMESEHSSGGRSTVGAIARGIRMSKSPSAPGAHLPHTASPFPPALVPLLDGEHHTDELCTRFNVGWPMLSQWLVMAGGGQEDGDYGDVCIIYR
ncbi:unnamed protein product [Somion occarium]|uniref:NPR2-domain-containing protein n=1 Tax=Somion occarium TaxID=3059160 RepID=A0ABP1DB70_9APHY